MDYTSKQPIKTALVTGASRRIGAGIARMLHEHGFRVAIHCHRSLQEGQTLAAELNQTRADSACVLEGDLSQAGVCSRLVASVNAWAGRLDVLVNNASVFTKSSCQTFAAKDWQELFAVNVQAPCELGIAAFPLLSSHQGVIVNITDIHAEKPLKGYAVYCQTKAALLMQTKVLAREFAPHVRVNAVAPGAIVWPEHGNALDEHSRQKIIHKTPLQRHGDPVHIAQAVWALVENAFITGQVLNVDGGRSIV